MLSPSLARTQSQRKSTCTTCHRTVHVVSVQGRMVAVDPELIAVVPSGKHGGALATGTAMIARRVHAEMCDGYRQAAAAEKTKREMRAFTKRQRSARKSGI